MRKLLLAGLLAAVMQLTSHAQTVRPKAIIPPIFFALDDTNIAKARAIIDADPKAVDAEVGLGVTPLLLIADKPQAKYSANSVEIMRESIKEEDETNTPIPLVARLLVEKGAQVNAQDKDGETALMYALLRKKISLACWLLDHGANINLTDKHRETALSYACAKRESAMAELLIARGADLTVTNQSGFTLLHWAVGNQMADVTKLLISKGADVNTVFATADVKGMTLLHVAAINLDTNCFGQLLAAGAKFEVRNSLGQTPLFLAAAYGLYPAVDGLLQKGADVNARDSNGHTPLNVAKAQLRLSPDTSRWSSGLAITIRHLKKHGGKE